MKRYVLALLVICSTSVVYAQNPKVGSRSNPFATSIGQAKKIKATDIVLNTTEDGSGRDYQISGSVSFTVEGKKYTRTFSNVEIGGFSDTELTNQDNDDRYYPEAFIAKPLDSEQTTLIVSIKERVNGFDPSLGSATKSLK